MRAEVVARRDQPYRAPARDGPLELVVVGGSQGARILSEVLPAAIAHLPKAERARLRLTQQCRPEDLERVASAYAGLGFAAELASFFDDLPERLARAQLVISRSGASSVAELLVLGRPALLVPYRLAADDHQRANAEAVAAGRRRLDRRSRPSSTPSASPRGSAPASTSPRSSPLMARRAHALGRPDAARRAGRCARSAGGALARQSASGGRGMRTLPIDAGGIHFVGIGGIGMSGIAEVLHNLGHRVQGSDLVENANIERLRGLGIKVAIGHRAANLGECGVVVVSSAVKADNPEVEAARGARVPVVRRAEMLGELMRLKWAIAVAGTHGKTTTTSLIAALLDAAKLDPTVINGGIINAYGTNARSGEGDWMVVEADESDGTFVRLPASIAVVTNIDPEHMEFYGKFDAVRAAFQSFLENVPFYGFAALCIDHPEVQALFGRITDRRLISYGFSPQADVRALEVELRPPRRRVRRRAARPHERPGQPPDRAPAPRDAGPPQRPERARRDRGRARARHRRRRAAPGARRLRRRQAALHLRPAPPAGSP